MKISQFWGSICGTEQIKPCQPQMFGSIPKSLNKPCFVLRMWWKWKQPKEKLKIQDCNKVHWDINFFPWSAQSSISIIELWYFQNTKMQRPICLTVFLYFVMHWNLQYNSPYYYFKKKMIVDSCTQHENIRDRFCFCHVHWNTPLWYWTELTNDLQASILVELPDVPSVKPALAISVHLKVLSCFGWILVVAHGDIWPTNHHFSTREGLVSDGIASYKWKAFQVHAWRPTAELLSRQKPFTQSISRCKLTLSLLRVINIKFPLQPPRNITSHSMENLTFHSLFRWEMIILQILTASLIQLLLKRLRECTFWAQEWKG